MKAPVLIYYLVLFAFAGTLMYSLVDLGNRLGRQFELTQQAVQQESEVLRHGKMVK